MLRAFILLFVVVFSFKAQMLQSISNHNAPETPIDSPGAGTYGSTQSVTLTDPSADLIYYTIDGSTPACPATGTLYTGAISVAATTTIKAIGCNGVTGGGVLTSVYTITVSTTSRTFNGTSQKLDNATGYISGATVFTVAFWFKSGDVAQTNTYIMDRGSGNGIIYGYVNDGSGHAQIEFYQGGNERTGSQITITDTNWHHVAYRYNTPTWDYFLDGTKTSIGTPSFSASTSTTITVAAAGSSAWFKGSLARLYFSTSALSDGQIAALAGATCSSSGVSGTTGYWLLGTASPDPESSPSPNTNSLTVTGATATTGPTCSSQ